MKKLKYLFLLAFMPMFVFTSCSDDDDDVVLTSEQVVGTWNVTWAEQDGESMDVPSGYIQIDLKNDGSYKTKFLTNTYIGTYKINGNTIVGTTIDPITEYYQFASLNGNNAEINYSNSEGDKYKFKATKK